MERHRRIRRSTLATALGAALAVSVFAPPLAGGDVVGDVLNGVGIGGVADDRAGVPPTYQPPLHGTNPHGQGTVATVDLFPSDSNPYQGNPEDGSFPFDGEEVIIGDSRGEQQPDGSYHGRVTLLYLLGVPIVQVESGPGETDSLDLGPGGIVLGAICGGTTVCLDVLSMDSSSSGTGSNNSFQALDADLGNGAITANVAQSSGNINQSGNCQTATGSSSLANGNLGPFGFDVLSSSSSSTACNDGTQSTSNTSLVDLPFPLNLVVAALAPGCQSGAPNTAFTAISPLAAFVCNADDQNSGQAGSPYGVREAFSLFALIFSDPGGLGNTAVLKLVLSGPESRAVAPPAAPTTPAAGGPAGQTQQGGPGNDQGEGGAAGAVAGEAGAGEGVLAFTGANLLALLLIGAGLIGLGLLAMAARERQTA